MSDTHQEGDAPVARVRRTVAAPRYEVYRAWLDPDVMRTWFAPAGFGVAGVEVDERVGGRVRVWHVDEDGRDVGGHESEILELVPGERIAMRFRFVGPDRTHDSGPETLLTVTFTPADGGTVVEIVHERLEALRAVRPDIADQVGAGWASALENLARALDEEGGTTA